MRCIRQWLVGQASHGRAFRKCWLHWLLDLPSIVITSLPCFTPRRLRRWSANVFGRNDFDSSSQIPLDRVAAGSLGPFGFVDPSDGGKVKTGVVAAFYRTEWTSGDNLKVDGFLSRSLFDLYTNFAFFLSDPGDARIRASGHSVLDLGATRHVCISAVLRWHPVRVGKGQIAAFRDLALVLPADLLIIGIWCLKP